MKMSKQFLMIIISLSINSKMYSAARIQSKAKVPSKAKMQSKVKTESKAKIQSAKGKKQHAKEIKYFSKYNANEALYGAILGRNYINEQTTKKDIINAINKGADINNIDFGDTPLLQSISRNETNIAKLLLEKNANPNTQGTSEGWYPLELACNTGNSDIIKMLLDHGAELNPRKNEATPLMFALKKCDFETIQLLINAKADVNALDSDGDSALVYAEDWESSFLLLDQGADINLLKRKHPSEYLNKAILQKHIVLFERLLRAGAVLTEENLKSIEEPGNENLKKAYVALVNEKIAEIPELVTMPPGIATVHNNTDKLSLIAEYI